MNPLRSRRPLSARMAAAVLLMAGFWIFSAGQIDAAVISRPVALVPNAVSDTAHDELKYFGRPLATDRNGTWVAAWQDTTNKQVLVSRSADNGTTWSAPVAIHTSETTETSAYYSAYPEVATDSNGTWIVVWRDSGPESSPEGTDGDIFYSRSEDNGQTWSPSAFLDSGATNDPANSDASPTITAGPAGEWMVFWHSGNAAAPAAERDLWFSRSGDEGKTWSPATPFRPEDIGDSQSCRFPSVATDKEGNWLVAWGGNRTNSPTTAGVFAARSSDGGTSWSTSRQLSGPLNSVPIALASMHPGGEAVVSWSGLLYNNFSAYVRSKDAGASWSPPAWTISPTTDLSMAVPDGHGNLFSLSFPDNPSPGPTYRSIAMDALPQGSSDWSSAPVLFAGNVGTLNLPGQPVAALVPVIATDGNGRWICLFQFSGAHYQDQGAPQGYGTDYDLFAATLDMVPVRPPVPAAAVGSPVNRNASTDTGDDLYPQIATDGLGRRVTVWQSSDSLGGTKGTDTDILVSRSTDTNQNWSPPAVLNSYGRSDNGSDTLPGLATDDRGVWIATWLTTSTLNGQADGKTRVAFSRSSDAGASWSPAAQLNAVSTATLSQTAPSITAGGQNTWMAAWTEIEQSFYYFTAWPRLARSTDRGVTWTPVAFLESRTPSGGYGVRIASDGSGNWLTLYRDANFVPKTGYLPASLVGSRSTDDGLTWSPSGEVELPQDIQPESFDVRSDGHGTWMLVWANESWTPWLPVAEGVRFSRSTDGGRTWSAPEVVSPDLGSAIRLACEGPGRWLCVWRSQPFSGYLPGEQDILVSRSTDNGQTWSEPVRLDRGPAENRAPAMALDAQGRPVIAWSGKGGQGGGDFDIWFSTASSASFTGAADWQLFE